MAVEINDNKQHITSSAVKAILEIVHNRTKDKLDTSAFTSVSGTFATTGDLQDYQTISGMNDYALTSQLDDKEDKINYGYITIE